MPYHNSTIVTPLLRAEQLPDEFDVKGNQLHCKWCDKVLISLRNDNLREHLHSRIHQENRIQRGATMSFDPDTARMRRRRALQKKAIARRKEAMKKRKHQSIQQNHSKSHSPTEDNSENCDTDSSSENSSGEQLSQLFEETDSEDIETFEGFDDNSQVIQSTSSPKKRRGRPLKRPARLSDAFDSAKPKQIRKTDKAWGRKRNRKSYDSSSSSSIPFRAMPLKKQMSYKARSSFPPTTAKKGKLKIKISRQPKARSNSFHVDSSEGEDSGFANDRRVTSYKGTSDGLKMKFVIDKPRQQDSGDALSPKTKRKSKKRRSGSSHDSSGEEQAEQSYGYAPPEIGSSVREVPHEDYQANDNIFEGIQEVAEEEIVQDVEVVEEEIVGVDEGEVVSWDAVVGDDLLEDISVPSPQAPASPKLSSEQTLAIKANYAREMAKAVNSAQFKKKRLVAKKQEPKPEEKERTEKIRRRVSGYNLWSSKMRRQVANQYPGLQFGDISKKLGDLWKKIPDKEKQMWKNRGDKPLNRVQEIQTNTTKRNKGSRMIETGPKKKHVLPKQSPKSLPLPAFPPHKAPELTMQRELNKLPLPTLEPIDAACHFHLLGQSLTSIGNQVQTSGSISGSDKLVPLLLDSLVCSFAPLLSLVNHVPQLQGSVPESTLVDTFANIAYIMPGY